MVTRIGLIVLIDHSLIHHYNYMYKMIDTVAVSARNGPTINLNWCGLVLNVPALPNSNCNVGHPCIPQTVVIINPSACRARIM